MCMETEHCDFGFEDINNVLIDESDAQTVEMDSEGNYVVKQEFKNEINSETVSEAGFSEPGKLNKGAWSD